LKRNIYYRTSSRVLNFNWVL